MAEYKILLGTQLDLSDIVSQINAAESKIDPIKIKVDAETKELTKSIQDALKTLSGGTKNALTLDTSKLEASLNDVNSTIKEIKVAMGTLDSGSGMKSLVGSINSISTALDKASAKFDELVGDLKSLSGKDFSLNFGINIGGSNPIARNSAYGSKVRSETLPQLKKQAALIEQEVQEYYKKILKTQSLDVNKTFSKLISGTPVLDKTGVDIFSLYGDMNAESLKTQMQAYKQYINVMKEAAKIKKIDISGATSQFSKSADQLVQDAVDIQTGAKEMDESFEKLKQIFGGGNNLNVEGLSAQLDSIVVDLNEIRTTLQSLSSGVSFDGLTASFDRLSTAIENLLANAERVKGVLGDNLGSSVSGGNAVKSAQQTGQKIGETVKQSVKQSLTLDDVIDEQVQNLMNQYGIVGKKGSKAFEEIRQALVEYRAELALLSSANTIDDDFIEILDEDDVADIRKVTDALTANMKVADQTKEVYEDLVQYVKQINNSGNKVFLPDSIKQEYGDDFASMRSQLGAAFTTQRTGSSVDFEVWLSELNSQLGNVIDMSNGAEAAFGDLVNKLRMGRDANFLSGNDLVKSGILDMDDMEYDVINALGAIEEGEKQLAQVSAESANTVVQAEERKQQAYKETADEAKKAANSSLSKEADKINKKLSDSDLGFSKYDNEIDNVTTKFNKLENQSEQLQSDMRLLNSTFADIKAASAANDVEALVNANKEYEQVLTRVKNQIDINSRAEKEAAAIAKKEASEKAKAEKEAAAIVNKMQKEADAAALKETNTELKKLEVSARKIGQLDFKIVKSDYNDEINQVKEFERQLELVKKQYNETAKTLSSKGIDISSITTPEFVEARNKMAEFGAQVEDTKRKLAAKIQTSIGTDIARDVQKAHSEFDKLSDKSGELRQKLQALDNIQIDLETASEHNDVEKLITLYERYESTLKEVKTQLDINKRAERDTAANLKLADDRNAFQSKIDAWLTKNSAAAKRFGAQMLDLKAKAEGCDRVTLNHLEAEFKQVDRAAEAAGKKTQTFMGSLKSQFSKYSSYFSVASAFMYVEQGLRSMFEQVKLIDSAMTELKKVTDETDASYNKFLSNAASRSKELGTTIDGLVGSTADFARLGYSFEDAQGLAEVANIYAVVGDDIEGVEGATESLISTLAAFKEQAGGMNDTDFAMKIIDIYNELGNKFAISSGGLGEALERSASSLAAANNTLEESASLITAANEVVQNPEKVGNAMKTISMRMKIHCPR